MHKSETLNVCVHRWCEYVMR